MQWLVFIADEYAAILFTAQRVRRDNQRHSRDAGGGDDVLAGFLVGDDDAQGARVLLFS